MPAQPLTDVRVTEVGPGKPAGMGITRKPGPTVVGVTGVEPTWIVEPVEKFVQMIVTLNPPAAMPDVGISAEIPGETLKAIDAV